jgi:hypothetical protein
MPHSSVVHVKSAEHISDDHPQSVKNLHAEHVQRLKDAGHTVHHEHVHDHDPD